MSTSRGAKPFTRQQVPACILPNNLSRRYTHCNESQERRPQEKAKDHLSHVIGVQFCICTRPKSRLTTLSCLLGFPSTASCATCKRVLRYMVTSRPQEARITQFGYYQRTNISSQGSAGSLCTFTCSMVLPLSILSPISASPYPSLTTWLAFPIL